MIVFISGGCKNGKSTCAQHLAKAMSKGGKMFYLATMIPHDEDDEQRIRRHVAEREGWGFETVECSMDIASSLALTGPNATVLMDSVTALLSNEMFREDGSYHPDVYEKVAGDLCALCRGVENIVLVSDYIYSDAELYDTYTERYRRGLAHIDRALARLSDTVIELCSGNLILHKGTVPV